MFYLMESPFEIPKKITLEQAQRWAITHPFAVQKDALEYVQESYPNDLITFDIPHIILYNPDTEVTQVLAIVRIIA